MRFAAAVGRRFDRFALVARGTADEAATPYELTGPELVALPDYGSLRRLGRVAMAVPATVGAMWRSLDDLDAIWVSGVHPLGLVFALLAVARRRRVVLLIRQDSPRYFRSRLPGRGWAPLLLPLRLLDLAFRLLGRWMPVTVVGGELAERYGAPRPSVLDMRVTLLERSQLAPGPRDGDWETEVRLLTVGRIAPEKNPELVPGLLANLNGGDGPAYTLTWVGEGPLAGRLREDAAAQGVKERLVLPGFVPFGDGLLRRFAEADAFVHIALTEGVPGVIYEAMGSGLPIVATDVGGIREALEDGEAGLLVPPGDAGALAEAVRTLARDEPLRRRFAERALALASARTLESESERVSRFIAGEPEP